MRRQQQQARNKTQVFYFTLHSCVGSSSKQEIRTKYFTSPYTACIFSVYATSIPVLLNHPWITVFAYKTIQKYYFLNQYECEQNLNRTNQADLYFRLKMFVGWKKKEEEGKQAAI